MLKYNEQDKNDLHDLLLIWPLSLMPQYSQSLFMQNLRWCMIALHPIVLNYGLSSNYLKAWASLPQTRHYRLKCEHCIVSELQARYIMMNMELEIMKVRLTRIGIYTGLFTVFATVQESHILRIQLSQSRWFFRFSIFVSSLLYTDISMDERSIL